MSRTCTPRSPILLKVKPANCGIASLICAKDIFDRMDAACSRIRSEFRRKGLNQIAQDFPIVARLARVRAPRDSVVADALAVDHRAALFSETERRQDGAGAARSLRSRAMSMTTKTGSASGSARVIPHSSGFSPSAMSALIWPDDNAVGDLLQIRSPGSDATPQKARAVRIRIAIRAQQNVVARTGARNDVDQVSTPSSFASREVSQSSSFVIRPEARIAISQPA